MNNYALDANIVSFLIKRKGMVEQKLENAIKRKYNISIPPFAYYEVKRGLLRVNASKRLQELVEICKDYPIGDINSSVFEEAAIIWADLTNRGLNIDEMDIFIAAWRKVNDFTLVTNNTKHFSAIQGLRTEDWSL